MTNTENRLADRDSLISKAVTQAKDLVIANGETPAPEISIEEQARRAQVVLDSHRQSRVLSAQQELDALLKRHNVGLEIRQILINGMPQPAQITLVLNPDPR